MTRIVLIGTVHEENGLATTSSLLEILESVRPEVVFLEIPSVMFPAYDEGTLSTLESRAARRYRETTGAALVPVDRPTPDESFFRDWQYMDRRVTATNPSYRLLVDQNTANVAKHGFSYLNSDQCRDDWSKIYVAMEEAIELLSHDTSLPVIYETIRSTNELRDEAMLQGIDAQFSSKPFTTGVLLVGASHVCSIVNRSREGRHKDAPCIECWVP